MSPATKAPRSHRRRDRWRILNIGSRQVRARGFESHPWSDLYHQSMTLPWPVFFAGFAAIFLLVNCVFAALYLLGDAPIANARPGLVDLFYFSIETLATVGYGDMHPQTNYGHMVATVEIFTGLSIVAVLTGLVFARFSRPRARIIFARHPVIGLHDGRQTLMVRMANARHNMVTDATAKLWITRLEDTAEGHRLRRFHELKLERSQNPVFALSWTLFHAIDATSPLHGSNAKRLAEVEAAIVVTFSGVDETSGQTMNARMGYDHDALHWNHRYVDILGVDDAGTALIDYRKFHDTHPE